MLTINEDKSFLIKHLPAVIQYENESVYTFITDMSVVNWSKKFDVIERNCSKERFDELYSIKEEAIEETHWLKKEVENYYIPLGPLKRFSFSSRVKDEIIDSLKRAVQWSTDYGESPKLDPDALLMNLIHQLFGYAEQNVNTNRTLELSLVKKNAIEMNRYLIDYKDNKTSELKSFLSRAPNAQLAVLELQRETGINEIINVCKVSVIERNFSIDKQNVYSIVYRLRSQSITRTCYYYTKFDTIEEVFTQFANEYPEAVVSHVVKVIENPNL